MIDLKVGEVSMFSESCGLAKIKKNGKECYVVFGKLWPNEEDVGGGILGKGLTALEALTDTIVRLLSFQKDVYSANQLISFVNELLECGKINGSDSILPTYLREELEDFNGHICFDEGARKFFFVPCQN